jgi:uncharacterized RDD family membrane protein YckC
MLMASEIPGMGRRLAALALDLVVLRVLEAPLSKVVRASAEEPVYLVLMQFVVMLLYATILVSRNGQTLGKMAVKLRVINVNGGSVQMLHAALRSVVKWTPIFCFLALLAAAMPTVGADGEPQVAADAATPGAEGSALAAGLSYAAILLGLVLFWLTRRHPDRRSVHDRVAGTVVMRVP